MFIPGLELSARFYREAVRPLLGDLPHTAARLGTGSEVLGFDTTRSADHDWGPRLQLFVPEGTDTEAIELTLSERLPKTFLGWPTNFASGDTERVGVMAYTDGPVRHRVDVVPLGRWLTEQLAFDPRAGVTTVDWLATPTQWLAEVTGGAVFHDGDGELTAVRDRLSWYPDEVWRYVLASQWDRVGEEELFVERCLEVGDDLGAAVVAARIIRDLMRLCLLMHRRYPPYSKWLGSAFGLLPGGLDAVFRTALATLDLAPAYTAVATVHNELGLTEPLDPAVRRYLRSDRVLPAGRFVAALAAGLPGLPPLGAVDQVVDNATFLCDRPRLRRVMVRGYLAEELP